MTLSVSNSYSELTLCYLLYCVSKWTRAYSVIWTYVDPGKQINKALVYFVEVDM